MKFNENNQNGTKFNENRLGENEFDLSASQLRILLAELKNEGTKAYHLYTETEFAPEDEELVTKAVPYVFSGNFRLQIRRGGNGSYVQYFSDKQAEPEIIDASDSDEKAPDSNAPAGKASASKAVESIIAAKKKEGISPVFDGPLYRIYLIRTEKKLILFGIIHHLISDGVTIQSVIPKLFKSCISELRQGREPELLPCSYGSYIERVKEYRGTDEAKREREYWINRLDGYRGIAYDAETLRKGVLNVDVPEKTTEGLRKIQEERRLSPFVAGLSSAFLYFMESGRRLGAESREMVWEISVNGRYYGEDIADDPGMFVETLPLRLSYDENRTAAESFEYVKSVMKEGLAHAKTDTNEYFDELARRGVEIKSLTSFSAVSNSSPAEGGALYLPDETDVPFHIRINVNCLDADGLQRLSFEYNKAIFKEKDIRQIAQGILKLAGQAAADPELKIKDADLPESRLPAAEHALINDLKTADEPVFLQSGMNREASKRKSAERHTETLRDRRMKYKARFTAAFMNALVRFALTKEILIGIKQGTELLPFGMKIDTSEKAEDFLNDVKEKLKAMSVCRDYKLSCRRDIQFSPSIALSFKEKQKITGDILISACVTEDGLALSYDADRYGREYMKALLESIRVFYKKMTDTADSLRLKDIPLVKAKNEKHEIILKNEGTVGAVFERMARENPDKEILIAPDRTMTYRELDEESSGIAAALMARGIAAHDRVLILMRRTSALVVSIFGVTKAGAVFITMDPDYPAERINQITGDSEAAIVITDIPEVRETIPGAVLYEELKAGADQTVGQAPGAAFESGKASDTAAAPASSSAFESVKTSPDDMCFIIYTSGTTGRPKGVVLTHRGITNYIAPERENEPMWYLKKKCRAMLCLSSVSFIVFLREIFGTILNGIPVVLSSEEQMINPLEIAALIKEHSADALGLTPTRLLQYMQVKDFSYALRNIKFMIVGGEGFPGRLYDELRRASACEIYNSYGPTEVTIASHQKKMVSSRVSAGFPMLNVWDRIADVDGGELPPYAVGELYVGGAGVAQGYFHADELTAERFPVIDGERYVNTGDLAYRSGSGEVFVLGRNDGMIKLRGLRIELEEIENVLGSYPGVSHARVVVQNIGGTEHLCAFYTLAPGMEDIPSDEFRKLTGSKLPPYMVPTYYTRLKEFPLTPNGKVAVKQLKDMPVDTESGAAFEAPRTKTEELVFEAAAKAVGTEAFGIHDNLMQLGLTSLSIISVVTELEERLGVSVRITDLLKRMTVSGIAELAEELTAAAPADKGTGRGAAAGTYVSGRNAGPGDAAESNAAGSSAGRNDAAGSKVGRGGAAAADAGRNDAAGTNASGRNPGFGQDDDLREYYPLTENQLGIYLECEAHPESAGYHLPNYVRFGRDIDPERLKNAVVRMIDHHPYLLVSLEMVNGTVMQKRCWSISADEAVKLERVPEISDERLQALAAEPFELTGNHLFRFRIFVTDDEVVLFSMFHHIIVDGGSINIIYRDIAAAYDGKPLTDERTDGYKNTLIEKSVENSRAFEQAREFFGKQMEIADEATILTPDLKGDEARGSLGAVRTGLDAELIDAFCRKHRISQNVLFMSALSVVLTKFISEDRLLINTVSNGRLDAGTHETVALLMKTLPLVLKPERSMPVTGLFEYASNVWMETMANQAYPFTSLAREYELHPEFFYTYHGKIYEEVVIGGRSYARERISYDSLRYKVMVNVILEDQYYIQVDYNDALYSKEYIKTFLECIRKVLLDWSTAKSLTDLKISDVELAAEKPQHILHPLKNEMIHQAFEAAVKKSPDKDIVTSCGETLTYDELNSRANRIAHALKRRGLSDGGSVMLLIPRNCDMIASIIGVLKAGAAYIPMDIEYPDERIRYVMEDAGADFVITDRDLPNAVSLRELLGETDETAVPDAPDLTAAPDGTAAMNAADETDLLSTVDMDRICYMIYTSGSTGRPKGVEISHKNIYNLCQPVPENVYYHARPDKPASILNTGTISFDISVLDIIGSLLNGIRIILANDEENRDVPMLVSLIHKEKPEAFGMITPSRMQQYLQDPEFAAAIGSCRMCAVGGEPMIPSVYNALKDLNKDMDIYNIYGPTETTVTCNSVLVRPERVMSVGKPLYNVVNEICDIDGKLLPDGVVGELYIGGNGVARGYHGMPEKTSQSFIVRDNMRFFRSGDFAYRLPDGEVIIMGRRDGQIKLRGLRIETGEIEESIKAYEGIESAAAVVRKLGKTEHLCGYFTSAKTIDTEALRQFLLSRLTPYMVPTILMQLDEMPYTPSGKTDRKRLPEPEIKRDFVSPSTDEETFFCSIFEEVLELPRVGATDDFFSIGGSSLLATQLIILASNGGYDLKYRDIFENPTPRKLALHVCGSPDGAPSGTGSSIEKDIAEYDYSAIHRRLAQNTFENFTAGERREMHSVLLTGATGFLGIHVLKELLEAGNIKVFCMLRGNEKVTAESRLRNRLFYYFDDDFHDAFGIRLFVRDGEITDKEDFNAFDDTDIDTIINCAASVKHFSAGNDIYEANVNGVENGLTYAVRRGCRYIHISTTSTGGEILLDGKHGSFIFDEQTLYKGQILDNQYLSSKFLAERLVLSAAAEGADVKVIRVGNLMARDADGMFQMNFNTNGFINRLRAYVTLHEMPYGKMLQKMEMSPVDVTARAIAALSKTPTECCLFNCYNNHVSAYGDILNGANEKGIEITPVSDEEFEKSLSEAMLDENMQEGIYGLITTVGMGTGRERAITEVRNDYTTMALYHEGIYWPVISERYIASFIDFLNGLGFWE